MSELEDKVISALQYIFADTEWKSPRGGTVPLSFYAGRRPAPEVDTAPLLDDPEEEYEDPYILVREVQSKGGRLRQQDSVYLWAVLWDDVDDGELSRLIGYLEMIIDIDDSVFLPWGLIDDLVVKRGGDEWGNQAEPVYLAFAELNFYRGR